MAPRPQSCLISTLWLRILIWYIGVSMRRERTCPRKNCRWERTKHRTVKDKWSVQKWRQRDSLTHRNRPIQRLRIQTHECTQTHVHRLPIDHLTYMLWDLVSPNLCVEVLVTRCPGNDNGAAQGLFQHLSKVSAMKANTMKIITLILLMTCPHTFKAPCTRIGSCPVDGSKSAYWNIPSPPRRRLSQKHSLWYLSMRTISERSQRDYWSATPLSSTLSPFNNWDCRVLT